MDLEQMNHSDEQEAESSPSSQETSERREEETEAAGSEADDKASESRAVRFTQEALQTGTKTSASEDGGSPSASPSPKTHRRSTSEGSVLMKESLQRAAAKANGGDGSEAGAGAVEQPIRWEQASEASLNLGSLLRLFRSEFFDVWMCISYLYRYPRPGVHDYLVNQLYSMPDDEVEFYLVQLCTMLVHAEFESTALQRFLMDKCKSSIHFALKVSWLFAAAIDDDAAKRGRCEQLQEDCEMAVVNSKVVMSLEMRMRRNANLTANHSLQSASTLAKMHAAGGAVGGLDTPRDPAAPPSASPSQSHLTGSGGSGGGGSAAHGAHASPKRSQSMLELGDKFTMEAIEKQYRCEYFNAVLKFVEDLGQVSDRLRLVPIEERQAGLQAEIEQLNTTLPIGLYLPLWEASKRHHCIVRLVSERAVVLKSRERVPFILMFETIESNSASSVPDLHRVANSYSPIVEKVLKDSVEEKGEKEEGEEMEEVAGEEGEKAKEAEREEKEGAREVAEEERGEEKAEKAASKAVETVQEAAAEEEKVKARGSLKKDLVTDEDSDLQNWFYENHQSGEQSPFGVPWRKRCENIRANSPFGHLPSWSLKSLIIKYGDELRQEYLAMQLIDQFRRIFADSKLTLFLKPYRILVNSGSSGLIETLTDTASIHQLKRWYGADGTTSLSQHFDAFYGKGSHARKVAVGNFVESLAAYSIVSYILQIKDRHNGNIMLSASGHVIHIDFGFILSNSPGNLKAENAPFKFTQDFCDVMGGTEGAMYHYFVQLLIKGFLEVRKHTDKLVQLVEMMAIGSKLPCFSAGQATIAALRDRFHTSLTEDQLIGLVNTMIEQSLHSWRTQFYDRFQYLTNNILY